MPLRVVITQGTAADCTQAGRLIEGLTAEHLIADKGYDSDAIVEQAKNQGMAAVIPPRKNRTTQRSYDEALYNGLASPGSKTRSCISNAGAASPQDFTPKMPPPFLAAVQIRCIALWANIS